QVTRVSRISAGGAALLWRRFVAHVLLNARAFAAAYNASLESYRAPRRIRGTRHPIPDLQRDADSCELPFWIIPNGGPRQRLVVREQRPDKIELFAGLRPLASLDASALRRAPESGPDPGAPHGCLRPRALALTLFVRLFASDLFIHGLGGAKYDQITDE